jgi:pimeloyl-ACP methyl ester carboxylesterase
MTRDLSRLLQAAKIGDRVVLVGSGFAALSAQLYAAEHPAVAGVILIEPHTEVVATAVSGKGWVGQSLRPAGQIAGVDVAESLAQVRGISLGALPLRLVLPGGGRVGLQSQSPAQGLQSQSPAQGLQSVAVVQEQQNQLALLALSSRSQVVKLDAEGDLVEAAPSQIAGIILSVINLR